MSQVPSVGWLLLLFLSLLFSLFMGLTLVWVSIERTDMAYTIRQLHNQLDERLVLRTKLEVERDRLLSPYILGRKAVDLGMREARPGQIRRMPDPVGHDGTGSENINRN